uniref:HECT domain-containing protein n=1 Tax=Chromera velia CCMP2878 TaxID=1169474 RepID=A0A0G4HZT2_9ALVE|eukprot:Cvel_9805.t1-p1 / transcript=Cvel_9805.t1 / gene=Cvel_9805 / organism=Chromera_velia_CCMP2878 / gene_product=Probable E3 ubiquitin-protein ligase HERC2, putative / transcript_product=Probable E3 ubiquitin-protein ligase HERC2, putative / location=Cvel_scaffold575:54256-64408(-) / protein_length=2386 / sequence_SO=supercontig / SO=protein_coding / is_pseudo=false
MRCCFRLERRQELRDAKEDREREAVTRETDTPAAPEGPKRKQKVPSQEGLLEASNLFLFRPTSPKERLYEQQTPSSTDFEFKSLPRAARQERASFASVPSVWSRECARAQRLLREVPLLDWQRIFAERVSCLSFLYGEIARGRPDGKNSVQSPLGYVEEEQQLPPCLKENGPVEVEALPSLRNGGNEGSLMSAVVCAEGESACFFEKLSVVLSRVSSAFLSLDGRLELLCALQAEEDSRGRDDLLDLSEIEMTESRRHSDLIWQALTESGSSVTAGQVESAVEASVSALSLPARVLCGRILRSRLCSLLETSEKQADREGAGSVPDLCGRGCLVVGVLGFVFGGLVFRLYLKDTDWHLASRLVRAATESIGKGKCACGEVVPLAASVDLGWLRVGATAVVSSVQQSDVERWVRQVLTPIRVGMEKRNGRVTVSLCHLGKDGEKGGVEPVGSLADGLKISFGDGKVGGDGGWREEQRNLFGFRGSRKVVGTSGEDMWTFDCGECLTSARRNGVPRLAAPRVKVGGDLQTANEASQKCGGGLLVRLLLSSGSALYGSDQILSLAEKLEGWEGGREGRSGVMACGDSREGLLWSAFLGLREAAMRHFSVGASAGASKGSSQTGNEREWGKGAERERQLWNRSGGRQWGAVASRLHYLSSLVAADLFVLAAARCACSSLLWAGSDLGVNVFFWFRKLFNGLMRPDSPVCFGFGFEKSFSSRVGPPTSASTENCPSSHRFTEDEKVSAFQGILVALSASLAVSRDFIEQREKVSVTSSLSTDAVRDVFSLSTSRPLLVCRSAQIRLGIFFSGDGTLKPGLSRVERRRLSLSRTKSSHAESAGSSRSHVNALKEQKGQDKGNSIENALGSVSLNAHQEEDDVAHGPASARSAPALRPRLILPLDPSEVPLRLKEAAALLGLGSSASLLCRAGRVSGNQSPSLSPSMLPPPLDSSPSPQNWIENLSLSLLASGFDASLSPPNHRERSEGKDLSQGIAVVPRHVDPSNSNGVGERAEHIARPAPPDLSPQRFPEGSDPSVFPHPSPLFGYPPTISQPLDGSVRPYDSSVDQFDGSVSARETEGSPSRVAYGKFETIRTPSLSVAEWQRRSGVLVHTFEALQALIVAGRRTKGELSPSAPPVAVQEEVPIGRRASGLSPILPPLMPHDGDCSVPPLSHSPGTGRGARGGGATRGKKVQSQTADVSEEEIGEGKPEQLFDIVSKQFLDLLRWLIRRHSEVSLEITKDGKESNKGTKGEEEEQQNGDEESASVEKRLRSLVRLLDCLGGRMPSESGCSNGGEGHPFLLLPLWMLGQLAFVRKDAALEREAGSRFRALQKVYPHCPLPWGPPPLGVPRFASPHLFLNQKEKEGKGSEKGKTERENTLTEVSVVEALAAHLSALSVSSCGLLPFWVLSNHPLSLLSKSDASLIAFRPVSSEEPPPIGRIPSTGLASSGVTKEKENVVVRDVGRVSSMRPSERQQQLLAAGMNGWGQLGLGRPLLSGCDDLFSSGWARETWDPDEHQQQGGKAARGTAVWWTGNPSEVLLHDDAPGCGETPWSAVACGDSHTAALDGQGRLFVWGSNKHGQLGILCGCRVPHGAGGGGEDENCCGLTGVDTDASSLLFPFPPAVPGPSVDPEEAEGQVSQSPPLPSIFLPDHPSAAVRRPPGGRRACLCMEFPPTAANCRVPFLASHAHWGPGEGPCSVCVEGEVGVKKKRGEAEFGDLMPVPCYAEWPLAFPMECPELQRIRLTREKQRGGGVGRKVPSEEEREREQKSKGAPPAAFLPVCLNALRGPPQLRFSSVSCGMNFCAVIDVHGGLWTWGEGSQGELGHGDLRSRCVPSLVDPAAGSSTGERGGVFPAVRVVCGAHHVCLLSGRDEPRSDGKPRSLRFWTWGDHNFGQLGLGPVESDEFISVRHCGAEGETTFVSSPQRLVFFTRELAGTEGVGKKTKKEGKTENQGKTVQVFIQSVEHGKAKRSGGKLGFTQPFVSSSCQTSVASYPASPANMGGVSEEAAGGKGIRGVGEEDDEEEEEAGSVGEGMGLSEPLKTSPPPQGVTGTAHIRGALGGLGNYLLPRARTSSAEGEGGGQTEEKKKASAPPTSSAAAEESGEGAEKECQEKSGAPVKGGGALVPVQILSAACGDGHTLLLVRPFKFRGDTEEESPPQVWAFGNNQTGAVGVGPEGVSMMVPESENEGGVESSPGVVWQIPSPVVLDPSLFCPADGRPWWSLSGSSSSKGAGGAPAAQVVEVFAGGAGSGALDSEGRLWVWGLNDRGQLGTVVQRRRTVVDGHSDAAEGDDVVWRPALHSTARSGVRVKGAAFGAFHSVVLTEAGEALSYGQDCAGATARGTLPSSEGPPARPRDCPVVDGQRVGMENGFVVQQVAVGGLHTMLLGCK